MLVVHCPRHGARALIWPSGIDAIRNTPDSIDVHFHCTCGYRGVLRTGRAADRTSDRPLAGRPA